MTHNALHRLIISNEQYQHRASQHVKIVTQRRVHKSETKHHDGPDSKVKLGSPCRRASRGIIEAIEMTVPFSLPNVFLPDQLVQEQDESRLKAAGAAEDAMWYGARWSRCGRSCSKLIDMMFEVEEQMRL